MTRDLGIGPFLTLGASAFTSCSNTGVDNFPYPNCTVDRTSSLHGWVTFGVHATWELRIGGR